MKFTQIKTFEDACKALNYDAELPNFSKVPEKHKKALEAHYQLIIIAEAINEGWQPDWNNTDEYKYELFPDIEENKSKLSGFGLAYNFCVDWGSDTIVGSRLCFQDTDKAKYCFETFKELWETYFLIDK